MIEIKDTGSRLACVDQLAADAAKTKKIAPLVRAWAKVENDDRYSEEQKRMATKATMWEIWRILEGERK